MDPLARQLAAEIIVKPLESLRLNAYLDTLAAPPVWTIGWGHTGGVLEGDTVTLEEANALLDRDLAAADETVSRLLPDVRLSSLQRAALVSFAYNLGAKWGRSTLRRHILAGRMEDAAGEFYKWRNAGGVKVPGLMRRRGLEEALWRLGS